VFDGVTFTGDAVVGEATFSGRAQFGGAAFTGDVWFRGATFIGDAWFEGATGLEGADVGAVRVAAGVQRQWPPIWREVPGEWRRLLRLAEELAAEEGHDGESTESGRVT